MIRIINVMAASGHVSYMICAKETLSCRQNPYQPWRTQLDWLDGSTEIELSSRHLRAYWDADIIDVDDKNKHDTIIERKDPFEVRFRVYLKGRLWNCICGHWCFNVGFTAIGNGEDFNLSDVLPDPSVAPDQGLERLRRAVHRLHRHGARREDPGGTLRDGLRGRSLVRAALLRLLRGRATATSPSPATSARASTMFV